MRCFLAIHPPEDVIDELAALRERMRRTRADVSWPAPENLHMTLRFLGETTEEQAAQVAEALPAVLAQCARPVLTVQGIGAFPHVERPSVVWVGVDTPDDTLDEIQAQCEAAASEAGLKQKRKRFTPHITLGRVRGRRRLGALVRQMREERNFFGGEFTASAVTLFRSDIKSGGAVYTPLEEFPLHAVHDPE
ncbi:MAG TPA: RNA 2',3'-cyclic phosphodiesterase [Candidatus Hydrogenedentes bacterium]|nr:RNA 2',3'-cyclic phosphodiesterase [Candidatus Hydrogenedentota bacterium]